MSKFGAIGRGIYALISLLIRLLYKVISHIAFLISIGIAVYTVGDYTRQIIKDKKEVLDIIYWRDPKKSGIALGVILIALFLVSRFSLISLLAYGSLAVLIGTLGFRIFKIVEAKIQKTEAAHPFKEYLEKDLDVPQDRVHAQVDVLVENGRNVINHLRRLFFVENLCDSVKFGLLLWTLTYIGAWFSGFALIILFVIGVFSVPKVYEIYKEPIDANLALVKEHVEKVHNTLTENLPFLNKICPTQQAQKKEE